MSTNVTEFIQDLDFGNFKEKFGAVLSEVAIGVMRSETGAAKGKVTAEFEITMLSSEKVNVKSKLEFVKPTSRGEDKIYDVDLPIPKFNQFDPVLYDGIRTEIANSTNYYAFNYDGVMCPWYYVPTLIDDFILIKLVPETDLTEFTND